MKRTIPSLLGLAAIVAMPLAASAQPNGYGYGGGYGASGVIASVDGSAVTLRNGRTIFLKNGTQILPTGQPLTAGERISVSGYDAGNGNVNAQSVQILGSGAGPNGRAYRYDRNQYGENQYGENRSGNGYGYGREGDRRERHRDHDGGDRQHDRDEHDRA